MHAGGGGGDGGDDGGPPWPPSLRLCPSPRYLILLLTPLILLLGILVVVFGRKRRRRGPERGLCWWTSPCCWTPGSALGRGCLRASLICTQLSWSSFVLLFGRWDNHPGSDWDHVAVDLNLNWIRPLSSSFRTSRLSAPPCRCSYQKI